jgi:hypothetical protein
LTLPPGKLDHIHWDDAMPGFGLRLRGDSRRFVIQYRIASGASRRESLGDPRKVELVHRFHETDHMWRIHNFRRGF